MKKSKKKGSTCGELLHLQEELKKTQIELESAYSNFSNATDPDLIDSSIYEVNAILQRYHYLFKRVKNLTSPIP